MAISRICCIIDVDGFSMKSYEKGTYKNEFLIRELGFVRIDPEFGDFLPKSYRFDLTSYDFNKCKETWSTINYQSRYITGLSLKPLPGEKTYSYSDRFDCMKSIYKMCRQRELDVVAYKSGIWEKELLNTLQIPSLDLAHYGCPKYEELLEQKTVYSNLNNCGYHTRIHHSVKAIHCPLAEVTVFRDWLQLHYPNGQGTRFSGHACGVIKESSHQSSSADSCSDSSSS